MWHNPIVQETRELRESFASQHGHDADAIFQAIMEKQATSTSKKVNYEQYVVVNHTQAGQLAAELK
jgi:hypothetical protein